MSRYKIGYQKGYSSQHSLVTMFEKKKENIDKGGECGAFFVDLSKALDCLQNDLLLLAKPMHMGSIPNLLNSS